MKIISASRREDMPAFRMPEIIQKYHQYGEDCFWVLWTKNPENIVDSGMDFRRVAFQITVTGAGSTKLEPEVPPYFQVIESIDKLLQKGANPALINWRLDPLLPGFHNPKIVETLARMFSKICIKRCVTSFITWYGTVRNRIEGIIPEISHEEQKKMILWIKDILNSHGIELFGCVQPHLRELIKPSKCIDGEYYSQITGFEFNTSKDPSQRKACGCTVSTDIGRYRYCQHGCIYCYARPEKENKTANKSYLNYIN